MKETLNIYTRVSTLSQADEGTSLDSQKKSGIQRAKGLGFGYKIYDEESASSSKDDFSNRPVLMQLLSKVEDGKVKHLYVYNNDRLSRNNITWGIIRQKLKEANCILYNNSGQANLNDHMDNMVFGILSEITQYDNALRTERLKEGRRQKAIKGYWMGGPPPFGYKTNKNNKLILDKEQSVWIEKIFNWYSQGLSPKKIKHKLDGNVLTNRGKPLWSIGSIECLLRNSHPSGIYTYYEKEIPCPRIVEQDIWDKVQKRLKAKRRLCRGNNKKVYSYPLREIMFCGHCGTQMGGRSKTYSEKRQLISYVCLLHNKKWKESSVNGDWKRGKYCQNNVSMECSKTEDGVWESLVNILRLSHQEREMFKQSVLKQKKTSHENKEKEIEKLITKTGRTKESITLIEERIAEKEVEKISSREKARSIQLFIDKLQEALDKLSMDLIEMENDLTVLENDGLWTDWIEDYQGNLDKLNGLSREERIKEIKKYVKKIEVFFDPETKKHRLNLNLKLPLVGDIFKWTNKSRKKKGYKVQKGGHQEMVHLENKVRNIRTIG